MGRMKTVLLAIVLGVLLAPSWLQADGALPVINGLRVFRSGDNIGVEVSADKAVEYTCSKMPQLLRVVIDLPQTELGDLNNVYKYKAPMLSEVRLEKKSINGVAITRVSINLSEDAEFTAGTTPDQTKVRVMLHKKAAGPSSGAAGPSSGAAAVGPGTPDSKGAAAGDKIPAPLATAVKAAPGPASSERKQEITVSAVNCADDGIEIVSGGSIGNFKAFILQQPGRLVIDIPGARTTLGSIAMPPNRFGIVRARIAPFEGKLRVVFDTGAQPFPNYQLVKTATGLRIALKGKN